MPASENAAIARELTDAFDRGDMAALDRLTAEDIVWHEIGRAEPRRGKAALREAGMGAGAAYTITGTVHDILASAEHAVVLIDATATRGGRTFSYRTAEIYHVRDGKVIERWAFSDDTAAIATFFA